MRILFFGCDDFAAVSLQKLLAGRHQVVGLVTQPDKPKGRGMHVVYSATKELALKAGIEVYQPSTLRDLAVVEKLRSFQADLFVVIAYGKFLPTDVLEIPKLYCINTHASLLPKYRGAAPINWAIINGEVETGVTIFRITAAMDSGDILAKAAYPLSEDATSAEVRPQLAVLGADLLLSILPRISDGIIPFDQQDESRVTLAPKMHKELGHIRWTDSAKKIHDLVRGVQPWPGAFTFWQASRLKILEACAAELPASQGGRKFQPGQIVELHKDGFYVQSGDGVVLVKRVHPANSHAMDARAFLAGHRLLVGELLG